MAQPIATGTAALPISESLLQSLRENRVVGLPEAKAIEDRVLQTLVDLLSGQHRPRPPSAARGAYPPYPAHWGGD